MELKLINFLIKTQYLGEMARPVVSSQVWSLVLSFRALS